MQLIAHQELASAAASITFSSIPQTFTDLYLVTSLRTTRNTGDFDGLFLRINGSSASEYSARLLYGTGSGGGASLSTTQAELIYHHYAVTNIQTANTFANAAMYIPNYTSSSAKSISTDSVTEVNGTTNIMNISAGLWNNSSAITSISFGSNSSSDFMQYSSATLYGITAGSSGGVTVS
jgi:hypothetical protein